MLPERYAKSVKNRKVIKGEFPSLVVFLAVNFPKIPQKS